MTAMAKVFGRLRTKTFHAGTRVPQALCYGERGFRVVLCVLGATVLRELRLA